MTGGMAGKQQGTNQTWLQGLLLYNIQNLWSHVQNKISASVQSFVAQYCSNDYSLRRDVTPHFTCWCDETREWSSHQPGQCPQLYFCGPALTT